MNELVLTLKDAIAEAARKRLRAAGGVTLCAAAKTRSFAEVRAVIEQGVTEIGENYVQEAEAKYAGNSAWPPLKEQFKVKLRLIGHLQGNKAARAAALFDSVDSVDSEALLQKLNKARAGLAPLEVLLQYNPCEELSKNGVKSFAALEALAITADVLPNLSFKGLMCMAPLNDTAGKSLAVKTFNETAAAFERLKKVVKNSELTTLSMGMSGDFKEAVAAGATLVRIGTALFGRRV
jgi:pyridoxal phosphate enzyme (YggS family)